MAKNKNFISLLVEKANFKLAKGIPSNSAEK